jgi:predicted DCC family thiol-disulfide oxidoreductase YuxK
MMQDEQSKIPRAEGLGGASGPIPSLRTEIFVDGNCIVCDNEISHYKKLAPDLFQIVDISSPEFNATKLGLTFDDVNKNMHVLTPQGEIKVGVDAFAHIWSRLSRYRIAATMIQWPGIYQLAKVGYSGFTLVRPYLPKRRRL